MWPTRCEKDATRRSPARTRYTRWPSCRPFTSRSAVADRSRSARYWRAPASEKRAAHRRGAARSQRLLGGQGGAGEEAEPEAAARGLLVLVIQREPGSRKHGDHLV